MVELARPQRNQGLSQSSVARLRHASATRGTATSSVRCLSSRQQPADAWRVRQACAIRFGGSVVTSRRKVVRGIVWMLSKLTTQSVGTPSAGVSGRSETNPRSVRVRAATTAETTRSATGSRVRTRTGRSASCSAASRSRCWRTASRRSADRSVPSSFAECWIAAASSSSTRELRSTSTRFCSMATPPEMVRTARRGWRTCRRRWRSAAGPRRRRARRGAPRCGPA